MGVFVRYGYRLTSMAQVGQEAGLTRQALYHHFPTKEALFRAVAESVNQGAQDAAEAAGRVAEAAGEPLARILCAQIAARWGYFRDRLNNSPHAAELMSEHQRQTLDLMQAYYESAHRLMVNTILRAVEAGAGLAPGTTADRLARSIQLAERGAKADPLGESALADLEILVELLVRGALNPPPPASHPHDGGAQ